MSRGRNGDHSHLGDDKNPPRNYFTSRSRGTAEERPLLHDKLMRALLHGTAELDIRVLSPVHVGSGAFDLVATESGMEIAKAPMTRQGRWVIPGSSIKGMCRQTHEALTESASPFEERLLARDRQGNPKDNASKSAILFGTLGYRGRVSFDDAEIEGDSEPAPYVARLSVPHAPLGGKTPERARPRPEKLGRRFYGPQPAGAKQPPKIPALAIPADTVLKTRLRFQNCHPHELGAVFLALGLHRFTPKLGGGKYDRWGWVRFELSRYRLREKLGGGGPWIEDPEAVHRFAVDRQKNAEDLLSPRGRRALITLVEKMQAPGNEKGGAS